MDDDNVVDDWADSFDIDGNGVGAEAPETPDEPEAPEAAEAPEEPKEEVKDEPAEPKEEPEEPEAKEADSKDEEQDEKPGASDGAEEGARTEEEAGEPAPTPEPLTKDDIKNVLKEVQSEQTGYIEEVKSTSQEVLEAFYPEGIDRQLRDADGDPIKNIDDVMNLTDPRTGENFTEEAAARWLLTEQQKLNQQVQDLEKSAERVAEVNVGLKQDALRVVEKYVEVLGKNPELANKVKSLYEATLRKDPKTGITLEAPANLIEFYDTFLEPYVSGPSQTAPEPPAPEPEKPKANPDDRADLPTTNGNDNLSKEDREWAEIAKDYQSLRN